MGLLSWAVYGLIVGIIAKLLMPGRDPGGCVLTILLGISGAVLGGYIGRRFLGVTSANLTSNLILAVLGAMLILSAYRLLLGKRD